MIKLIILHFLADFIFQSREMAIKKSQELGVLFVHCSTYAAILALGTMNPRRALGAAIIHAVIDWNVWRFYKKGKKKTFKYWEHKGFYDLIGMDQALHMITLALVWGYK